jgi:inward rectifier potassium channel
MAKHTQEFGTMRYEINGIRREFVGDIYHTLMRSSWLNLIGFAFIMYAGTAFFFALLLAIGNDNVAGAQDKLDLFWFSIQSLSTIGYGYMHPESLWGHIVIVLESFTGFVGVAIITAVLIAKFSRPKARVDFAEHAVLLESKGKQYLQIRFANARGYPIVNAKIKMSVLVSTSDIHGKPSRKLIELPLVQSEIPFFGLSFTATHALSDSIFANMSLEELHNDLFLLIISFSGIDEILEQEVRAQHFYRPENIIEHVRYKDMVEAYEWGASMNLTFLDQIVDENAEDGLEGI